MTENQVLLVMMLAPLVASGVLVALILPFYRAAMSRSDTRELVSTIFQMALAIVLIQVFWVIVLLIPEEARDPQGWVRYSILVGFVATSWTPVVMLYRLYVRIFLPKNGK